MVLFYSENLGGIHALITDLTRLFHCAQCLTLSGVLKCRGQEDLSYSFQVKVVLGKRQDIPGHKIIELRSCPPSSTSPELDDHSINFLE